MSIFKEVLVCVFQLQQVHLQRRASEARDVTADVTVTS